MADFLNRSEQGDRLPGAAFEAERRSGVRRQAGEDQPFRSLTRTTLYRIGAGVTAIIALTTAVTYHLLYREIEQHALARLTAYSAQRAHYHEAHFAFLKGLHEVVRKDFLARYAEPPPADLERRFDRLMSRYPDGAMRNSATFSDVERYSSGWIHRRVQPDREFVRRWLLFFDLSEKYKNIFTSQFANIYFMHPSLPANMGYDDPERSGHVRWVYQTPADYALDRREYFYLADSVHNPRRETVWGGTYYEPAYRKILVPGVTPVYVGDEHIANIGTDDILDELETSIRQSGIPGASHTVFRADGRLIVDPSYMAQIMEGFDGFNIRESHNPRLERLLKLATEATALPRSGLAPSIDEYFAISRLPSNGWFFASTMPGHLIRSQAFQGAQWVLWAGLGSLVLLLLALAAILRRQIGQPLQQLLGGIQEVAAGVAPAVPLPSSADEFGRLAMAFNEMARKVWERDSAVNAEKERFRALIEQGADIISVVDAAGLVCYVSPSIERVLGFPPEHYVGRSIFAIVHPDDVPSLTQTFQKSLLQPGMPIATAEYRRRHADGQWRWFEAIGTNQIDNPAVAGIVVNARDITEAKRSEEELCRQRDALHQREKLAAMGSLLAGVAHELNNPLSIVVGRAIMLEEESGDERTRAAARKIRAAAERCARIVKTFLAMARQRPPEQRAVQIARILDDCLEILGYSLRTSGIEVVLCREGDLPEILADGDQLHQVFVNLLVNAQQALVNQPEPRRITVASGYEAGPKQVWVAVADNGPGVPREIHSRIFEPYFTTKPTGVGTGVGLAVSLGIVEAHGGRLELRCPDEGGAVFRVSLPAIPAQPAEAETPADPGRRSGSSRRILIVDDEPEVGALLSDILASADTAIDMAGNGGEALRRIAENPDYAAILTDLRMPEMDGATFYRTLCKRWPRLAARVIFVTGDALSADARVLLETSERKVLEKPFIPAEVRQAVDALSRPGPHARTDPPGPVD